MKTLNARGAGALLSCMFTAGCATLQHQAFSEPETTVDAAQIAGGLQSQHFDLDLQIYNPNYYRLDASRIRYRVLLDSMEVATGMIERRVTLKPRESAVVRVPVEVAPNGVAVAVRAVVSSFFRGGIPFELAGEMRIETLLGSVTRGFEQKGTYDPIKGHVTIFKRGKTD